jgi:hypothetical protein
MDVNNGRIRLDQMLATYARHGEHHVAHVHQALSRRSNANGRRYTDGSDSISRINSL